MGHCGLLTIDDGAVAISEDMSTDADVRITGPERAWVEALGPDASRTELEIEGDASIAESLLDALAPAAMRTATVV